MALLLAALGWIARRNMMAVVLANACAVVAAIGLFEIYLALEAGGGDETRLEGSINEDFTIRDDVLGYRPRENVRVTARKFHRDTLIYDVAYTIGPDGLRVSAPHDASRTRGCLIFFGDSITFGEGVKDEENYPYRVAARSGGRYAVHNFAFSGYGPHQMLANLLSDRLQGRLRCQPTYFFYLVIPEHVERVAGMASWDKHGPRFRLAADGSVQRDGNFDAAPRLFAKWSMPQMVMSSLDHFRVWQKLFGRQRRAGPAELALLIAVIRESARRAAQRYPQSVFHVLLWDGADNERVRAIETALTGDGTPVHRITRAIPDFRAEPRKYVISEYDLHPNALQHALLADYLLREVLRAEAD